MARTLAFTDCGIYLFMNTHNHKVYVGSSQCLRSRESAHRRLLKMGVHSNPHFQSAWSKYGQTAFNYCVLEYCDPRDLCEREDWWIQLFDSMNPDKGYNKVSASRTTMLPEVGRRISHSKKGSTPWNKGRTLSLEMRDKLSRAHQGRPGRPHTEETKRKIAQAHTGMKASPKARENMSHAQTGKRRSEAHRRAMSIGRTGKALTDEHKQAIATGKRRCNIERIMCEMNSEIDRMLSEETDPQDVVALAIEIKEKARQFYHDCCVRYYKLRWRLPESEHDSG